MFPLNLDNSNFNSHLVKKEYNLRMEIEKGEDTKKMRKRDHLKDRSKLMSQKFSELQISSENSQITPTFGLEKQEEPIVWTYFKQDENNSITLPLPLEIANSQKVIYIVENTLTRKALIGKTGSKFSVRIANYLLKIRSLKKSDSELITDVRQNPTLFRVGILHQKEEFESLSECERNAIKARKKISEVYNKNIGGGGGSAKSQQLAIPYYVPNNTTPPKYRQFIAKDDRISLPSSPGLKQEFAKMQDNNTKERSFVYSIKNVITGQRYTGVSIDPVRRVNEHMRASQRFLPYKKTKKRDGAAHPAIGEDPTNHAFGIYPLFSTPERKKDKNYKVLSDISDVEKHLIKVKNSRRKVSKNGKVTGGYNITVGGNGSFVSPKLNRYISNT